MNVATFLFTIALAMPVRPLHGQQSATRALPQLNSAEALGQDLFVRSGSTGMVLVVVRGTPRGPEVFFRGFGETAIGSAQTPNDRSLLRLCSLSKIFATDLLVKLTGDKLVRLDEPLQKLAPPTVVVPSRAKRAITLADLATHTSGLPREVGRAPAGSPHFTFPDYTFRWHWLPVQHLRTTPGAAALYSNVGFDLLGDALERAAAKPYATLLAERTTTPLGMHETGFTPNAAQCTRLLQGTHDEGPCTDTQMSAGSSGLYSTAADMALWLQYLLGLGASAQSPAAQAVFLSPATLVSQAGLDHAGTPTGIGLGWIHLTTPDGHDITEKTGGGAGFLTYIALNQAEHTGIFLAATDGAVETHLNVFRTANNLLLALDGLPPIPDPPKPAPKHARKAAHKRAALRHPR